MSNEPHRHPLMKPFIHDPLAQPEIYETPDPPTPSLTTSRNDNEESDPEETEDLADPKPSLLSSTNELVQSTSCSVKWATTQFESCGVDASTTDFSSLEDDESKKMYQTYRRTEYEQLSKDMKKLNKEPIYQRYLRLKGELEELELECHEWTTKKSEIHTEEKNQINVFSENSPHKSEVPALSILDNLSQLHTKIQTLETHFKTNQSLNVSLEPLKHHLEALQQQSLPSSSSSATTATSKETTPSSTSESTSPSPSTLTYEIHYKNIPTTPPLSNLEKRITQLEKWIGQPSLSSPCVPLITFLSHLEYKIQTLVTTPPPPSTSMTQGDDFFPSKPNESSFKEDPSLLNQVNACYTLIQQLEPMLPLIPMILDRLLSLQILHMEASETLVGLQRWMQLMSTLQSETHCLKKQCDTLTESIQLNKAQMEQNTFVLLEKIQSLEKKLASANE